MASTGNMCFYGCKKKLDKHHLLILGTFLRLWLAFKLGRSAYRSGARLPGAMPTRYWLAWYLGGCGVDIMLVRLKILFERPFSSDNPWPYSIISGITLVTAWCTFPAVICWFVGRTKRRAAVSDGASPPVIMPPPLLHVPKPRMEVHPETPNQATQFVSCRERSIEVQDNSLTPPCLYWLTTDQTQFGPISKIEILQQISEGKLSRNDLCWSIGMPNWARISEVFRTVKQTGGTD